MLHFSEDTWPCITAMVVMDGKDLLCMALGYQHLLPVFDRKLTPHRRFGFYFAGLYFNHVIEILTIYGLHIVESDKVSVE